MASFHICINSSEKNSWNLIKKDAFRLVLLMSKNSLMWILHLVSSNYWGNNNGCFKVQSNTELSCLI